MQLAGLINQEVQAEVDEMRVKAMAVCTAGAPPLPSRSQEGSSSTGGAGASAGTSSLAGGNAWRALFEQEPLFRLQWCVTPAVLPASPEAPRVSYC